MCADRFVGHRLDLLENALTVVGELRVDDNDSIGADEDRGIAAVFREDEKVVPDFLDAKSRGLRRGQTREHRATDNQRREGCRPVHDDFTHFPNQVARRCCCAAV